MDRRRCITLLGLLRCQFGGCDLRGEGYTVRPLRPHHLRIAAL
jgi:hypothetical protein